MDSPNVLLLILAAVLFLLVFVRPRAALRRGPGGALALGDARDAGALREELDSLVAQLQDVSREQIARLDTKIQILHELVAEADRKIAEMKAAAEALREAGERGAAASVPTASALGSAGPPPPEAPASPLHDRIFKLADGGAPLAEIAAAVEMPAGEVDLILGLRGRGAAPVARGGER